jgi:hypothetical protein
VTEIPTGLPEDADEDGPLGVPADADADEPDELPGLPDDEPDSAG